MRVKIYRGTKEIGGTCVELTADNGKVLWIDLGVPLNTQNPDTSYRNNKVDALLISHPHQDHYGLMESLPYPDNFGVSRYTGKEYFLKPLVFNRFESADINKSFDLSTI